MSKTISDKTKGAVSEVLVFVWDDAKKRFPMKLKGAIGAALFLVCLASCGKSQAEKDVDVLTSTTPSIQNIDKLLGEIKGLLKSYCNEAESMSAVLCGDPDAGPKYHTISPQLLTRLAEFKNRVDAVLYDQQARECRARDGSGVLVNFPHGDSLCIDTFSKYNLAQFAAEKSKEFPGESPLVEPGRFDFAILEKNIQADSAKKAAESQKRLEDWAVRSYEAGQRHQDKCWDQLESRGYGDPGCY